MNSDQKLKNLWEIFGNKPFNIILYLQPIFDLSFILKRILNNLFDLNNLFYKIDHNLS